METTEIGSGPRRLTRPQEDRWLGGVAAGLGAYFDLSPTIYRIAFVALALAGGTGVLLYLAAWLVIPAEGADDSIAGVELKKHRDRPRRIVGLAILGFAAIVALSEAHFWPTPGNLWLALALGIAAIVGTVLLAINQGDVLLSSRWPTALAWKVPLTYLVPFAVATWGALVNSRVPR